jgi:hypothetical protein
MRSRARVTSIDAIRRFKLAMIEFMESSRRALTEAEADLQRTTVWMERDRHGHWKREIRKRQEKVAQAKSAVYRAELAAASSGARPDCVDERRALERVARGLREAEEKLDATQRWGRRLARELILYKGQAQPLATSLYGEIPRAVERLERLAGSLDAYVRTGVTAIEDAPPTGAAAVLARRAEAGLLQRSPHADLRHRAPRAEERAAHTIDRGALRAAPSGQPRPPDHEEVRSLELPEAAPSPTAKIVIERGCLSSRQLVLVRAAAEELDDDADSGWFIGAAGDRRSDPELVAVSAQAVMERRPDLRIVLGLPERFLVLLEGTAVRAVLNEEDIDLLEMTDGLEETST